MFVATDLSRRQNVRNAFDAAQRELGGDTIDVVVNGCGCGVLDASSTDDLRVKTAEAVAATEACFLVSGPYFCCCIL